MADLLIQKRNSLLVKWALVWNFYPDNHEEVMVKLYREKAKWIFYGLEIGTIEKKPHMQGVIYLRKRERKKTLLDFLQQFNSHPQGQICLEPQIAGDANIQKYFGKQEDVYKFGYRSVTQGVRTDMDNFKKAVKEGMKWSQLIHEHYTVIASKGAWAREFYEIFTPGKKAEKIEITLKDWQLDILEKLMDKPHDREIYIYIDKKGGAGKTTFCEWIDQEFGPDKVAILGRQKANDAAEIVTKWTEIVLYDIARKDGEFMDWGMCEYFKNGTHIKAKYRPAVITAARRHVFVFCNNLPNFDNALCEDRIVIKEL